MSEDDVNVPWPVPPQLVEDIQQLAKEHGSDAEHFFVLLLDAAVRATEVGRLQPTEPDEPCGSPELVHDLLTEARMGMRVSGDQHESGEAEAVVREELAREGLPVEVAETREYNVGRGYGVIALLLLVGGAVVAFFGGVKAIDDGAAVLKKWIRAMRSAARRLEASAYTAEFIKAVCVEKALEAGVEPRAIDMKRITAIIQHVDTGIEADVMTGHWTVTLPIAKGAALVYIVDQDGEVRSSAQLDYPARDVGVLPSGDDEVEGHE